MPPLLFNHRLQQVLNRANHQLEYYLREYDIPWAEASLPDRNDLIHLLHHISEDGALVTRREVEDILSSAVHESTLTHEEEHSLKDAYLKGLLVARSTTSHQTLDLMVQLFRLTAPVLVAVYIAGFVVVNSYVGEHSALSYEVFTVRYIAGAILFVFVTGPPALFLIITLGLPAFGIQGLFPALTWAWAAPRTTIPYYLLCYSGAVCMGYAVTAAVSVKGYVPVEPEWILCPALICAIHLGTIAVAEFPNRSYPWTQRDLGYNRLFVGSMITVIVLVGLTGTFGRVAYPDVRPNYGGGAGWMTSIRADSILVGEGSVLDDAYLLEHRGEFVHVMRCSGDELGDRHVESFIVADRKIETIRIDSVATMRNVIKSCKRER